jgi:hypothetical protein
MRVLLSVLVGLRIVSSVPIATPVQVVEVANDLDSPITDISDWVELVRLNLPAKTATELDLHIESHNIGLIGSVVDWFLPGEFDVVITDPNRSSVLFNHTFDSISVDISQVFGGERVRDYPSVILVLFRNRNLVFKQRVSLSGQLVSSASMFDLRRVAPQCPFPIYMQGMCGACYADVVAGAGTDMVCLSGKTSVQKLSPQPLVSCANIGGCAGGSPYMGALWTQHNGLVDLGVCPYVSGDCEPDRDSEKNGCVDCAKVKTEGFFGAVAYRFRPIVIPATSESAMRRHLEEKGPIMVIFDAHVNFQDFFQNHPFGIYTSVANTPSLGNHAVRLIGYGVDEGSGTGPVKYWIAVNSWGASWGDRGTFKIIRGTNICDIERWPVGIEYLPDIVAGSPAVSNTGHPHVGNWKDQEMNDTFWTAKVDEWRVDIDRVVGRTDWSVQSMSTRVGNGFWVKLKLDCGKRVVVHVLPNGTYGVDLKDSSVRQPENNLDQL